MIARRAATLLLFLLALLACSSPAPEAPAPAPAPAPTGEPVPGLLTVPFGPGAKVFEVMFEPPESWQGRYRMSQVSEGELDFLYSPDPTTGERLFRLVALPEESWPMQQQLPEAGTDFRRMDGVVFAYQSAPDTSLTGEEAEQFRALLAEVPAIVEGLIITRAE